MKFLLIFISLSLFAERKCESLKYDPTSGVIKIYALQNNKSYVTIINTEKYWGPNPRLDCEISSKYYNYCKGSYFQFNAEFISKGSRGYLKVYDKYGDLIKEESHLLKCRTIKKGK